MPLESIKPGESWGDLKLFKCSEEEGTKGGHEQQSILCFWVKQALEEEEIKTGIRQVVQKQQQIRGLSEIHWARSSERTLLWNRRAYAKMCSVQGKQWALNISQSLLGLVKPTDHHTLLLLYVRRSDTFRRDQKNILITKIPWGHKRTRLEWEVSTLVLLWSSHGGISSGLPSRTCCKFPSCSCALRVHCRGHCLPRPSPANYTHSGDTGGQLFLPSLELL